MFRRLLILALGLMPLLALADSVVQGANGNRVNADANNNLNVVLSTDKPSAGYVRITDENTEFGADVSSAGRLKVGQDTVAFSDRMDGTVINPYLWAVAALTMTTTQASSAITLNAGAITTASTYAVLTSTKGFSASATASLHVAGKFRPSVAPQANSTMEIGWMAATTTTAPTNGCFLRWTPTGEFRAVLNFGGTETLSAVLTNPTTAVDHKFEIVIEDHDCHFNIDGVQVAVIDVPAGTAVPSSASHLPVIARVYTAASPPVTAPQLRVAAVAVHYSDSPNTLDFSDQLTGGGAVSAFSNPESFATTSSWANNATPATCTLSNTTACVTALGGQVIFTIAASTANDSLLFDYTVPPGYLLRVSGVSCAFQNNVALTATGQLFFFAGVEGTAVSLATADSLAAAPPVIAARRIFIGSISFGNIAAAPIGNGGSFHKTFSPALVVHSRTPTTSSGHFQIGMKNPTATGTSATIYGACGVTGYFE